MNPFSSGMVPGEAAPRPRVHHHPSLRLCREPFCLSIPRLLCRVGLKRPLGGPVSELIQSFVLKIRYKVVILLID